MVNPGTRLGSYEIGSVIGVGGMGEVYRARDTKLHRDVAVKVLPERVSHDGSYVCSAGIFARAQFAVAADGRFLMNVAQDVIAPPITFVVNWTAGLND